MNVPQENPGHLKPSRMKNIVPRKRLQALSQSLLAYRVTTVVAPAGYGKTVWVSSLLEEPGWPTTAWLGLDQHDAEPSHLLHHLIHALKRVLPGFGQYTMRTIASLENVGRDWSIATLALLEELTLDSNVLLVLDDIHLLYESQVAMAIIEYLLAHVPENVHLVLIARSKLPLKLHRLEMNDELLQIGSQELLFTQEEALALFSFMELNIPVRDAADIYTHTEGWAVGLRLMGIFLKQSGGSLTDAFKILEQKDSTFYSYLMHEFLETMPARLRDFFLDASLLPYLEAGLCDAAFQCTDSSNMLETLYCFGLFSPIEEGKGVWRIHHLIGAWLQDSTFKLRSPGYIAALRRRAAAYFEQNDDINGAIEQAVLCQDWERAAGLIHKFGYEYFTHNSYTDNLYKWIDELPENMVAADCWLLYFKGSRLINIDNNYSFQILSAALDLAVQNGDFKCESCSLLAMLFSSVFTGDIRRCEAVGEHLQRNPALLKNPNSRGEALSAALVIAMSQDNLQEGLDLSRQALRLKLHPELLMWVHYTTSHLLFRQGNLTQARQLIEETMAMPFILENERRMLVGYQILNDITFIMGDYRMFEETSLACLGLGQKYNMPGVMGRVYYLKAHWHYREDRLPEARRNLELAHDYFVAGGVVHFSNQAAIDMILLQISNGENARELLPELLELTSRFNQLPYGVGVDYIVKSLVGIAAMEAGEMELAGQLFEKSARRWNEIGAKQHQAGTNLLMAHLLLLQGQETSADNLLRKALAASEAWQWENFWEWHHETMYTMCQRALQKNIHPRWAARILSRWFPGRSRHELGSLLIAGNEQVRSLALEFFQNVAKETGPTMLHVFYLGGFRLFVNGQEVVAPEWKTQKAEHLFKFLVAGRSQHTKERLIQLLWPDSDLLSGDGKLRMTLSYVRKALGAAGLPSNCLLMQRGRLYLDPKIEIHCDYENFSRAANKALHYWETRHPYALTFLELAAQLYKGDFLPEDDYEDWSANLRFPLHNMYLEVLSKLAQAQYSQGKLSAALQICQKYLDAEPMDEPVIRLAMDILWRTGKKQKAKKLYHKLVAALADDYDTIPEPETMCIYQHIQAATRD